MMQKSLNASENGLDKFYTVIYTWKAAKCHGLTAPCHDFTVFARPHLSPGHQTSWSRTSASPDTKVAPIIAVENQHSKLTALDMS